MNSVVVAIIGLVLLTLGYRLYGKHMLKVWQVDNKRVTPAHELKDDLDYIPARHWMILFGHHFASIAGAGPILGPVLAVAAWGWLPAIGWIVLGTLFIGAVHDFSALLLSLRHQGRSIADVSEQVTGRSSRLLFAVFLWLTLVLIIAVFAAATAKTLVGQPQVVMPTFGLIVIAMAFGWAIKRWPGHLVMLTIGALALVAGVIGLGMAVPVVLSTGQALSIWIILLLVYALIASLMPVDALLQPRDYLSTFILFAGLGAGFVGLFLTHYPMTTPAVASFHSGKGPMWPMLFVFVACGAVSGFHALVASGTTAKQLAHKKDALKIGFGAMVLEAALALLAVLAVGAGLYWHAGPGHEGLVYPELLKNGNWIATFGKGFGRLTEPLFGLTLGTTLAVIMLNSFVMTTLDSATRIGRYLTEELFGSAFNIKLFKKPLVSTLVIVLAAAGVAFGNWQKVWPIFGAANQLIAALTLLVVSFYLIGRQRPVLYTLIPAGFMLVTTIAALGYQGWQFWTHGQVMLAILAILLLVLAVVVLTSGMNRLKLLRRRKEAAPAQAAVELEPAE